MPEPPLQAFPHRRPSEVFTLICSSGALQLWCSLLVFCERWGRWPTQTRYLLMCLIPKKDGGLRPIGLYEGLVRLWERIRQIHVRKWRAANPRQYDWRAAGSRIEDVWKQSWHDEVAIASGEVACTTLFDLRKAFETVALHHAWSWPGLRLPNAHP